MDFGLRRVVGGAFKRCWRQNQCTYSACLKPRLASTVLQLISLLAVCGQNAVAITCAILTNFCSWMCGETPFDHVPVLLGLAEMYRNLQVFRPLQRHEDFAMLGKQSFVVSASRSSPVSLNVYIAWS